LGEFEKRIKKNSHEMCELWDGKRIERVIPQNLIIEIIKEAKKEFPFASWLKEDLEELKMSIMRSIKERGHSVLDDEVSEEFIKTLDTIVKWFGTK